MKIGLALAGGGASGGAHIGVIRALEEAHISIDMIGGTSSGAMVAGLYASGTSTTEMLTLLPSLTRRHIDIDFALLPRLLRRQYPGGLLRGNRLYQFIETAVEKADPRHCMSTSHHCNKLADRTRGCLLIQRVQSTSCHWHCR